jgi:plastocyanin
MKPFHKAFLVAGLLFASGFIISSCKDDSGNGSGNPGQAGSGGGNAGTTGNGGSTAGTTGSAGNAGSGGSGGGSGGTPGFMAIAPCMNESDYVSDTKTITFPVSATDFNYAPKCLKVTFPRGSLGTAGAPGTNVTFSGDFATHPLMPSTHRGELTGNPIAATSAGTSATFYISSLGSTFYAYYCAVHNPSDNGAGMSGVIWAVAQ